METENEKSYNDIELRRDSPYGKPMSPVDESEEGEINLTDEQQDLLKQLMSSASIDQLRCASDCIQCMINDIREHNDAEVTVDDYQAAMKDKGAE